MFDDMIREENFIEDIFEIAFGMDAINKGYSMSEVVEKLREYSDNALKYEEMEMSYKDAYWITL